MNFSFCMFGQFWSPFYKFLWDDCLLSIVMQCFTSCSFVEETFVKEICHSLWLNEYWLWMLLTVLMNSHWQSLYIKEKKSACLSMACLSHNAGSQLVSETMGKKDRLVLNLLGWAVSVQNRAMHKQLVCFCMRYANVM